MTYLSTLGALHHPRGWYQGFDPTNQSMAGLALASLAIGVLGVLVISGEYGTGTIRSSLAAMPRRGVLLTAKVAVVGLATLVIGEVLSFVSFFEGQAVLSGGAPTATLGQPGVLRVVALSGAFLALFALLGLGLGAVIRHTAGAIAVFAGVTMLAPVLLHSISESIARYAPELIFANSVAAVVPQSNSFSATIGVVLMVAYLRRRAGPGRLPAEPAGRVTPDQPEDSSVRVRIRGRELSLAMTEEQAVRARQLAHHVLHEPFTKRVWSELAFFLLSSALAGAGLRFVAVTMVAGLILAITFFGLAVLALSLRSARGIGGFEREPGAQHAR